MIKRALKEFEVLSEKDLRLVLEEYEVSREKRKTLKEHGKHRSKVDPKKMITESFMSDPNLILEDEVHKLRFKVEAIRPKGVEVVELKSKKRYLFPWKIFEV